MKSNFSELMFFYFSRRPYLLRAGISDFFFGQQASHGIIFHHHHRYVREMSIRIFLHRHHRYVREIWISKIGRAKQAVRTRHHHTGKKAAKKASDMGRWRGMPANGRRAYADGAPDRHFMRAHNLSGDKQGRKKLTQSFHLAENTVIVAGRKVFNRRWRIPFPRNW